MRIGVYPVLTASFLRRWAATTQTNSVRQMHTGLLVIVFALASTTPAAASPPHHHASESRDAFYRTLKTIEVGNLSISGISVEVVGRKTSTRLGERQVDEIDSLKMRSATVALYSSPERSGAPILSGQLISSTADDPAGVLSGTFRWRGATLEALGLSKLQCRLAKVVFGVTLAGAAPHLRPEEIVVLTTSSVLMTEGAPGHGLVRLSFPHVILQHAAIQWGDLSFNATLESHDAAMHVSFDPSILALVAGRLSHDGPLQLTTTATLSQFVPEHDLAPANLSFSGFTVTVSNGQPFLTAKSVRVPKPTLKYQAQAVAAAKELRLINLLSGPGEVTPHGISCPAPANTLIEVPPDGYGVIERLNRYSRIEPTDFLLPTGDAAVKYIHTSALQTLYSGLAAVQAHNAAISGQKTTSTQVGSLPPPITGRPEIRATIKSGVITKIDTSPLIDPINEREIMEWTFSLIAPASVVGKSAGALVEDLLLMTAGGTRQASVAAGKFARTALSPKFGSPVMHIVKSLPKVAEGLGDAAAQKVATVLLDSRPDSLKRSLGSSQITILNNELRRAMVLVVASQAIRNTKEWSAFVAQWQARYENQKQLSVVASDAAAKSQRTANAMESATRAKEEAAFKEQQRVILSRPLLPAPVSSPSSQPETKLEVTATVPPTSTRPETKPAPPPAVPAPVPVPKPPQDQ